MHGSVIQYFLLHVYHSQSISRDLTGHYLLGNRYYFLMFGHRQPSLESSLEVVKTPEDEADNSNDKDIKQPESEPKVVTTIINSSFHTYIHTYHWFPQF